MTFSPTFLFYRDDRALDVTPPDDFWPALKVEMGRLLADRLATYPDRVAKGRMPRAEADRELRVARAIAEDQRAVNRTDGWPRATWSEMIHCLRREITLRRQRWPLAVTAGRMDPDEAERRLQLIEGWHDLLWHTSGLPEARAARAALDIARKAAEHRAAA